MTVDVKLARKQEKMKWKIAVNQQPDKNVNNARKRSDARGMQGCGEGSVRSMNHRRPRIHFENISPTFSNGVKISNDYHHEDLPDPVLLRPDRLGVRLQQPGSSGYVSSSAWLSSSSGIICPAVRIAKWRLLRGLRL